MAGKGNTLSKKTIIAIVAIIVLLFVAGLSVGIFLSDKGETEAVDGNQVVDGSQTEGNTTQDSNNNEQTGDTNPENPITDPDFNGVEGNENTTTTTPDNGNVEGTNNNNTITNNGTTNTGVTTGTDVNNVGETTVTRVEEQEKLVSRDYWDWWTPINVAVASTVANLDTTTPDLTVKKSTITGVGEDQFVYAGQDITYVITVTNNGNKDVENIEITDKIPQNTTFVSIDDAFILSKVDGELVSETVGTKTTVTSAEETQKVVGVKWVVTVPAGETVIAKFTVNVNKIMLNEDGEEVPVTGTISNTAIANGEESNEGEPTKTAIITNNKSSVITRDKEVVKTVKVGDQITYTITVTNTGDVEGSTYITDTVPEGTKFVSAKDDAIVSTSEDGKTIVTWSIKVGANSTVTREFTVEVNSIDGKIKNIGDVGGTPTNEDKNETADITVNKEVADIKRIIDGKTVSMGNDIEVKDGDVIEYAITVINNGSKDLKNVVVDEKLVGIKLNPKDLIIGDLKAGESKEISATYTVTYETDIKNKEDRTILNEVSVSGETVEKPGENPTTVEDDDEVETTVEETILYTSGKTATEIKGADGTVKDKVTAAGDVITYTITVTNTGNTTIKGLAVKDEMINVDKTVDVAVGSSTPVTGTYTVKQADIDNNTKIHNVATVGNQTPSTDVEIEKTTTYTSSKTATEIKGADGTVKDKVTAAGDVITYTITVTNTGNTTIKGLAVKDEMINVDKTVDVAVGSSTPVTGTYTVKQADIDNNTKIHNVATVGDQTPSTDVEIEKTTTYTSSKKATEIKGTDGTVKNKVTAAGDVITYTITVTNTGNTTIKGLAVKDEMINVDKTVDVAVGSSTPVTGTYTVKQADIDNNTKIHNVATVGDQTPSTDVEIEKTTTYTSSKKATEIKGTDGTVKNKVTAAGDVITYTITVTNTGNTTIKGLAVKDEMINVDKTVDVAVGSSTPVTGTYTVKQADIDNNTKIHNVATVGDQTPSTDVEIEKTTTYTSSKTATEIKGTDGTVKNKVTAAGDVITYTITVTNTGNTTIKGLAVKDEMINVDKTVDVAVGSSTPVTGTYTVQQADIDNNTKIHNVATVGNQTPSTDVEIEKTTTYTSSKKATEIKGTDGTVKNKVTAAGDVITYTITVTNTGNTTIKGLAVKDEMINVDKTVDVAVGSSTPVTGTYTVKQADIDNNTKIHNVATVGDQTPSTDVEIEKTTTYTSSKKATEIKGADGTVKNKVTAAGDVITYTITVTNTGNTTIKGLAVKDEMINVDKTVDVAVGSSTPVTGTYTVKQADIDNNTKIHNVATVGDQTPSTDIEIEKTTTYTSSKKATEIKGTDGTVKNKVTAAGDVITYTITVTNTGNTTIKGLAVKDEMINVDKTVDVAVGSSTPVTGTYTVQQADIDNNTKIHNVATVGNQTPSTDVEIEKTPHMKVEKTATAIKDAQGNPKALTYKVRPGDVIEYTITITNDGNVTLTNIVVTDTLKVTVNNEIKNVDAETGVAIIATKDTVPELASLAPTDNPIEIKAYYTVISDDVKTETNINNVAIATADQAGGSDNDNKVAVNPDRSVYAKKVWDNIGSAAAQEYAINSIKLQVKNGNTVVAEKVVAAEANGEIAGNWEYTFTGLPKYDATGKEITYTVAEVAVNEADAAKLAKYTQTIDQETGIITNRFDPSKLTDTTPVVLTKIWLDNNNKYGTRPKSVALTVDGKTYTLTSSNDANIDETSTDIWTLKVEGLRKYDDNGNLITYTATENTVPDGYEKVSETGTTVTNRAKTIVEKTAYKATESGEIGAEVTANDVFKANETVYYKLTIKNAGDLVLETKTLTDTLPLRLNLISVDGTEITAYPSNGTDAKNDTWTVEKDTDNNVTIDWTVNSLEAGESRELIIKAQVVAEAEYQDLCQKTGNETSYIAKLYVRKDGKVPYEGSGTQYGAEYYTSKLGDVYLTSDQLHYDTEANLKNDDLYYLINNNNIITNMVSKGISREALEKALSNNGITLAQDEVVVWYVLKDTTTSSIHDYHIDGVIRKISDITSITNEVFMDNVKQDQATIDLEDIEIGQRGIITIKGINTASENVSTPMDVVFVLDTSGSMKYGLNSNNYVNDMKDSRAQAMVNAVNSTISTIMSKNADSRIGVVGYGEDASTIIKLGKYSTSGNYLTLTNYGGYTIKSNVTSGSRSVNGGTNTQSGIKVGADMLTAEGLDRTFTTTINGIEVTGTRTPIVILVTDGQPTFCYKNETATGNVSGEGYNTDTDEYYYYWTLRTAKYYKDQVTSKYYGANSSSAKMFTIGIGLDGYEATAMLNPDSKNVNDCNTNGYEEDWFGNQTTKRNQAGKLYDLIVANGTVSADAYDYADGMKSGALTESDIETFLKTSISGSQETMTVRSITTEESRARKIVLTNLDESKDFSLTVGETTYSTISEAKEAGYLKGDSTNGYYIDLTNINRSTSISLVYWEK